jgi:hypothetical protein
MSTSRDPDRLISAFIDEGEEQLNDQVYDAVRAAIEHKRQRAFIGSWRTPTVNKLLTYGLGAAAVVAVVLIGAQLLGSPTGGIGSQTTPTPEPTATPEPTPEGLLPEGPHVILDLEGTTGQDITQPLTVTIPAPGWYGEVGGGILAKNDKYEPPDGSGMIIFVKPEYIVYGDACHWESTVPETPATTVDELVAALSAQASRDASEPVDITVGGHAGKSITLEVPDDVDFTECDAGWGGSWDCGGDGMTPCGYHSGAGEIDTVYILDVDDGIMAWNTNYYAGTPAEDVAELEAIVQSASFGE